MDPLPPLLFAGLLALPTAALAATWHPLAPALAAIGITAAVCTRHRCRYAGLVALPILLAALPIRSPLAWAAPIWPRPGPVQIRGIVATTVYLADFDTTNLTIAGLVDAERKPLRLSCPGRVEALPGDHLAAVANLVPGVAPDRSPSLHAAATAVRITPSPPSLPRLLQRLRAACERELQRLVPGDRGSVLATLVLGSGTRAPREIEDAHRATGLSHLLAVSGAHAAMLGLMLGLGGPGRGRRLAKSRRHVLAALLLLFAYAGITGGEPPVVRAVLMYALGALAIQVGRPLGLLAGLMLPALVTAATEPDALLGPSFLLSYAAVCGLALARQQGDGFVARWLWTPLVASFWATCTTAPLTLFWFGQIAPWTILLTPLLAPLVAVLLLLGLVAALLAIAAPPLATPFGPLLDALTALYLAAVHAADHLPGTPIRAQCTPTPATIALAAVAAAAALLYWRGRWRIGAVIAATMLPWLLPLARSCPAHFRLFAIGHGQAALFQTAAGERIAIDCGSMQVPHLAARRLVEALPVHRLDWLIITHGDEDHHNGVAGLLQRVTVARALLPADLEDSPLAAMLRAHGAAVSVLAEGHRAWPVRGLTVAAPRLPAGASANDRSLWATIAVDDIRVLLTGDAEALGTAAAIQQGLTPACTVLVLPHHGRANPTAPALLQAVRPSCCLASAASADGETALGGLVRGRGAELWVTGQHGDLTLSFGASPELQASHAGRRLASAAR